MCRIKGSVIFVFVVLHVGCTHVAEPPPKAAPLSVKVGDSLDIQFGSDPPIHGLMWRQKVREDGSIALPFNQTVRAAGKTKVQLERAIRDIYVPKVTKHLEVKVHE
jgi:protein involved in polysaccharide export with SLBB domain